MKTFLAKESTSHATSILDASLSSLLSSTGSSLDFEVDGRQLEGSLLLCAFGSLISAVAELSVLAIHSFSFFLSSSDSSMSSSVSVFLPSADLK
jgi:hypothetical protein